MDTYICNGCGNPFTPQHSKRKYCSLECYFEHHRVTKFCLTCGKPFYVAIAIQDKRQYCSKECRVKGVTNPDSRVTTVCKQCGKEFEHWKSKKDAAFCSRQCQNTFLSHSRKRPERGASYIEHICTICGKAFRSRKSSTGRTAHSGECCSRECRDVASSQMYTGEKHWNYRGGKIDERGPHWLSIARKIRRRDNYTCQICGKNGEKDHVRIDVHHIFPYRQFDGDHERANRFENLISVCHSCHTRIEFKKVSLPDEIIKAAREAVQV